jgi:thiol-disulfide isomerase/thioredoxin
MNTSRRSFFPRLVALLAAIWAAVGMAAGTPKPGDTFPDLAGFQFEGALPELKGKVVIVDLWASWCGPCKKAMPVLKDLHEKYGAKGVVVVGVSLDETKADMDAYLKKNPMPFTIVRDPKGKLAEKLGVGGIPTSFVLAPDGKVKSVHEGFEGEATRKKYVQEIEALLPGVKPAAVRP